MTERFCGRPYCNDAATVISGVIKTCGCPGYAGVFCADHVPYDVCDCVVCGAELACWRTGIVPLHVQRLTWVQRIRQAVAA